MKSRAVRLCFFGAVGAYCLVALAACAANRIIVKDCRKVGSDAKNTYYDCEVDE